MKKFFAILFSLVFALGISFAAGAQQSSDQHTNTPMGTSSSTQSSTGNLSKADMKFLRDVGKDNNFEIQASQLAAQKASNPEVKDFAQKLVNDHTQLSNDLSSLAQNKGVTLSSSTLEKRDQKELNTLNKYSGKKFDREYMKDMVKDHKEDIKDFQKEAKNGKDSDLQSFASNHISALQGHLSMAQDLEKRVK